MATDVAAFAKQLKEEGIDAARKEGEAIIAEAASKAGQIIDEAKLTAEQLTKDTEDGLSRKRQRLEAELKLVARDLILSVKRQIEQVAVWLLKEKVANALSSEQVVQAALLELVKSQGSGKEWELVLSPALGKLLSRTAVEDLFKSQGAEVKLAEGFRKAGFELKTAAGAEVIEVSEDSITEAFRKLLSPELQKLLQLHLTPRDNP